MMDTNDPLFADIWRERQAAGQEVPSSYAHQFAAWAEETYRSAVQKGDLVAINQAKILLVDKFFEWSTFVPKGHRHLILHVFEAGYRQLKLFELSLTPPLLFLPPPPPPPPTQVVKVYKLDGYPIGQYVEDEEDA